MRACVFDAAVTLRRRIDTNRTFRVCHSPDSDYDVEPLPPSSTETAREAVDLSDLLKVLASRIEDFKNLLIVPRSVVSPL